MAKRTFRQKRLYQQVAEHLGSRIRDGEFPPGHSLPGEVTLAREYGISRNVMRETLVALELLGLVEVRAGSGAFVTDNPPSTNFTLGQIGHVGGPSPLAILEARRGIEGEVAFHAASNASDEDIKALAAMIDEAAASESGGPEPNDWPGAFHIALAKSTDNAVFLTIVESLWQAVRGPMFEGLRAQVSMRQIRSRLETRQRVVNAIKERDPEAARAAMHAHIDMVVRDLFAADGTTKNDPSATTQPGGRASVDMSSAPAANPQS
jgi:DNA-binding FadR family transcriptional regulator